MWISSNESKHFLSVSVATALCLCNKKKTTTRPFGYNKSSSTKQVEHTLSICPLDCLNIRHSSPPAAPTQISCRQACCRTYRHVLHTSFGMQLQHCYSTTKIMWHTMSNYRLRYLSCLKLYSPSLDEIIASYKLFMCCIGLAKL